MDVSALNQTTFTLPWRFLNRIGLIWREEELGSPLLICLCEGALEGGKNVPKWKNKTGFSVIQKKKMLLMKDLPSPVFDHYFDFI